MTPAEDAARAKEQEAQDLADIAELGRSQGFNRYYLRRLKSKREAIEKAFKYEVMPAEQREILRQKMILIEEIEKMPAVDQGSIRSSTPARGSQ